MLHRASDLGKGDVLGWGQEYRWALSKCADASNNSSTAGKALLPTMGITHSQHGFLFRVIPPSIIFLCFELQMSA